MTLGVCTRGSLTEQTRLPRFYAACDAEGVYALNEVSNRHVMCSRGRSSQRCSLRRRGIQQPPLWTRYRRHRQTGCGSCMRSTAAHHRWNAATLEVGLCVTLPLLFLCRCYRGWKIVSQNHSPLSNRPLSFEWPWVSFVRSRS